MVRELLEGMYSAMSAGDVQRFFDAIAEDVEVTEPGFLPYGGVWKGKDRLRELVGELGARLDLSRLKVESLMVEGDRGFAVLSVAFLDSDERFLAAEESRVRDGKVAELRVFVHEGGPLVAAHPAS